MRIALKRGAKGLDRECVDVSLSPFKPYIALYDLISADCRRQRSCRARILIENARFANGPASITQHRQPDLDGLSRLHLDVRCDGSLRAAEIVASPEPIGCASRQRLPEASISSREMSMP